MSEADERSVADGKLLIASTDPVEVRALYDAWADRYEDDVDAWDYRTPTDVAELLRDMQPDAARILDVGCGTGRTGRTLRAAGFTSIVGCDLSPNALAHAGATGAYERVVEVDLQQLPTPFADDGFDALNRVGVLTYLPDTEATLREFCRLVRPGGTIAFSQREDVWVERGCHALIDRLVAEGACEALRVSEPRPYLPKSDEMADVGVVLCVLRNRTLSERRAPRGGVASRARGRMHIRANPLRPRACARGPSGSASMPRRVNSFSTTEAPASPRAAWNASGAAFSTARKNVGSQRPTCSRRNAFSTSRQSPTSSSCPASCAASRRAPRKARNSSSQPA